MLQVDLITFWYGTSVLQEKCTLLKRLSMLKDLEISKTISDNDLEEPASITGLETFSLSYKVISLCLLTSLFCSLYFCLVN